MLCSGSKDSVLSRSSEFCAYVKQNRLLSRYFFCLCASKLALCIPVELCGIYLFIIILILFVSTVCLFVIVNRKKNGRWIELSSASFLLCLGRPHNPHYHHQHHCQAKGLHWVSIHLEVMVGCGTNQVECRIVVMMHQYIHCLGLVANSIPTILLRKATLALLFFRVSVFFKGTWNKSLFSCNSKVWCCSRQWTLFVIVKDQSSHFVYLSIFYA